MSDPIHTLQVRLPVPIKAWLDRQAAENRRSRNGEIIFRLEAAMRADQKAEVTAAGEASRA